ncbi:MAG TPA: gliding motility-associated C-terminal domain-containing protein [Flavobacteriaceae bacterium]|nr:gliding motility-associated C-terminal domain-containing protein [Flavobacteriaceae bacterium]
MKYIWTHIWLLLIAWPATAQIVNKGMAYLSPNTQFVSLYDFDNQDGGEFYNDGRASFYKNFNNDGIFDFYENTGRTLFIGQTLQQLSGANPSHFYELIFNNNSLMTPFQLSGDFNIYHFANFSQGIVDNRNFGGKMIFQNETEALNPWDQSFVNGPVTKLGTSDFNYPIGDEGYYRFAGTANSALNNHYQAEYFYANSNNQYPHNQKEATILSINNREYWSMESVEDVGEQLFVTFSYHNMATPQEFITAAIQNALVIVRWDAPTQQWINEAGSVNLNDKSITTSVEKLGNFTLARIEVEEEDECEIEVFNMIDISGLSNNKFMRIQSDCAENFAVKVFNRWGVKVFETDHYGLQGDVFDGYSAGRLTMGNKDHLPTGTYFYILNYQDTNQQKPKEEIGYLYIRNN